MATTLFDTSSVINESIAFTVATVAGLLLLFYSLALFLDKFRDSHDTLAGLMLHLTERTSWPLWSWFWFWLVLSLVFGVVLPWILSDNNLFLHSWLSRWHGLLFTLNYILVVPLLLWAYLGLLRETRLFFQLENLKDLGLCFNKKLKNCFLFQPVKRNTLSQVVLFLVGCIVLALTVNGLLEESCLTTPWVTKHSLTLAGYLYYSIVRGLDTYLAAGLVFLISVLSYVFYSGLNHLGFDRFLAGNVANLEFKPSIRRLINRLSYCLFLGPLVVTLHGLALAAVEYEACLQPLSNQTLTVCRVCWGGDGLLKNNLISWIWIGWAVVVSIVTIFMLYVIWRLNSSVKEAVVKKMQKDVESLWKEQKQSLNSYNATIEAFTKINAYVRSGGRLSNVRESLLFVILPLFLEALALFAVFATK